MRKINVYIFDSNRNIVDSYHNCQLDSAIFKQFTKSEYTRYFARDPYNRFGGRSLTIEVADQPDKVFVCAHEYRVYLDHPDYDKAVEYLYNYIEHIVNCDINYHKAQITKSMELLKGISTIRGEKPDEKELLF